MLFKIITIINNKKKTRVYAKESAFYRDIFCTVSTLEDFKTSYKLKIKKHLCKIKYNEEEK